MTCPQIMKCEHIICVVPYKVKDEAIAKIKEYAQKTYAKKGEAIVKKNSRRWRRFM